MRFLPWVARILVAAILFIVIASPAAAQEVSIPVGEIIGAALQAVLALFLVTVAWVLRFLPSALRDFVGTLFFSQGAAKAIAFGFNSVAGATQGMKLSFNVGNRVLAEAIGYFVRHMPKFFKWFLGSDAVTLAEKIWARLPMDADAAKPDFPQLIENLRENGWQGAVDDVPEDVSIKAPIPPPPPKPPADPTTPVDTPAEPPA